MTRARPSAFDIEPRSEESFEIVGGRADGGLLLVCDHACNAFPAGYGTLGLPEGELQRHIAYDIGAAAVTRGVAAALGAPALLTRYSRLLIDVNRGEDDPTLVMRLSDGAIVPGNRRLDAAELARRISLYYQPYHRAIDEVIDQCLATGRVPIVVSIHSFTESWKGMPRPWHVGILWNRDGRLAAALLEAFAADTALVVGDNQPYTGNLVGDCMDRHGTARGLAHAIIEVRQDLVATADGQAAWIRRVAGTLSGILAQPERGADLARIIGRGADT